MPEVTVLTAVRNGARHLPAALESVRAQTFRDWEYIVVDDGSTDATPGIVDRAARADPRFKLIRRDRSDGPFVAANEGLRHASGVYIIRLDADDVCLPMRIEEQVRFLQANQRLQACASFCQGLDDSGPIAGAINRAPLTDTLLRWELGLRCNLVHSSACVTRSALDRLGGYRELPLAQDYRFWCELARLGWLGVVPRVLVYFRRHGHRVTETRKIEQDGLAREVLRDHLEALTGLPWSYREAEALQAVGLATWFPVKEALATLRRWDCCWQRDDSLPSAERAELAVISAFRRRKFVRSNMRRQPLAALLNFRAYAFPAPASLEGNG